MKIPLLLLLLSHALIHVRCYMRMSRQADNDGEPRGLLSVIGLLWLLTGILLGGSFFLLLMDNRSWWVAALLAVALSQFLIIRNWETIKYGTLVNLALIVPIVASISAELPSGLRHHYLEEVQKRLIASFSAPTLTNKEIQDLPEPVRKYLRYSGAIGKPKVCNFKATFHGTMRRSMNDSWTEITAEQYDFFAKRARMFLIHSSLFGIPLDGLHMYIRDNATMRVKIAHIFEVADAEGDEMTRSETVTLFNDMCMMAPSTLIDTSIGWTQVDSVTAEARFTNEGCTISALLHFDVDGRLVDFVSHDRFLSVDGKTYRNYPWSTILRNYVDLNGRKVAGHADMVWHTPQGEFTYGKFDLADIHYNCTELR